MPLALPGPAGEAYSAPQTLELDCMGRGRERRGREERRGNGRGGKEGREKEKGREGRDRPNKKAGYRSGGRLGVRLLTAVLAGQACSGGRGNLRRSI